MDFISQPHKSSCGIASLAMILGITYEKAVATVFPTRKKHSGYGTTINHLLNGFNRLDYNAYWHLGNVALSFFKRNVLVILQDDENSFHAIVYNAKEKAIYDPLMNVPAIIGINRIATPDGKYRSRSVKSYYEPRIFGYISFCKRKMP